MRISRLFLASDDRLRATWRAILFLLGAIALTSLFGFLLFSLLGADPEKLPLETSIFLGGMVSAPATLLASYVFLRWFDLRSFRTLGLWFYDGWAKQLVGGLLGGILLITAVTLILHLLGKVEFQLREADPSRVLLGLGWDLLLFLPAAAFEEFLFRGYLFQRLVEGWGAFAAIFVLSALFGLGHRVNPSATPFSVANTVLIGIFFALCYLKTRGLWLPVGLHYGWNFWLGSVVSLPVSGVAIKHRLLDATVGGPAWLTGGSYGPEASVVTTVLVLAATVWLARTRSLGVSPAQAKELELGQAERSMKRRGQAGVWFLWLSLCAAWPAATAAATTSLSDEHRLDILRLLAYEYATTVQPLPACRAEKEAVEVSADGHVNENKLRQVLANRGAAVQPGEIVQVTGVEFQRSSILVEINGGGKKRKKWYERIVIQGGSGSIGTGLPPPQQIPPPGGEAGNSIQGSWVSLSFPGHVPDLSGAQVKDLLAGVLDFSRQSAAMPWIESIPEEFREAIKNKKAKVGMDREMVLAALGRPDRKVRETKNNVETEDWIYGNPPFVTFVVFVGETVVEVKEFR